MITNTIFNSNLKLVEMYLFMGDTIKVLTETKFSTP